MQTKSGLLIGNAGFFSTYNAKKQIFRRKRKEKASFFYINGQKKNFRRKNNKTVHISKNVNGFCMKLFANS